MPVRRHNVDGRAAAHAVAAADRDRQVGTFARQLLEPSLQRRALRGIGRVAANGLVARLRRRSDRVHVASLGAGRSHRRW